MIIMIRHCFFFLIFLTSILIQGGNCDCYFPAAFQGEFVTQAIMSRVPTISYSPLTIEYNSIPIWGVCHRRIGNNVILMDDTGGVTCFKCFNLVLRSSNVLQIHTSGLDKCYTTEERAMAECPTEISVRQKRSREIILYRTKGILGEPDTRPTYCPINGAYSFTYSVNDGTETSLECASYTSEISDCPYGFGINLQFKSCSFGNMEMSFHCLGDWEGENGERYVALMDTKATSRGDTRPRYRCAIYKENPLNGEITMALSSDSTCTNNLKSSVDGYETMYLKPKIFPPWPSHLHHAALRGHEGGYCSLPDWIQGKWQHIHVQEGIMILKDQRSFKTYTGRCVGQKNPSHEERFLIYTRTHCGENHYKCVWIKNRGPNTIEYQIGVYTSNTHNESLCNDENFSQRAWITQGRVEISEPTPYPIIGEYTGVIPDTDGFCAKLYSDCNNPEIMFYTIFNCFNRSQIYEEREYQCLGEWTEDGLIYTYTERRDMIGHECFVGLITAKGDIYLQEAGSNCERGYEPLHAGMKLSQVSKCYGSHHRNRFHKKKHNHHRNGNRKNSLSNTKIVALPVWRQKELQVDGSSSSYSGASSMNNQINILITIISLVSLWKLISFV